MSYVNGKWIVHQEIDTEELMHNVQILMKQNNSLSRQMGEIQEIKADLEKIQTTLEELKEKRHQDSDKPANKKILGSLVTLTLLGSFYLYFVHKPTPKPKKAPVKKAEIVKVITHQQINYHNFKVG